MIFLSAPQVQMEPANDPIALALVICILLVFAIVVIRKNSLAKKQAKAAAEAPAQEPVAQIPAAPGSAGQLKLHNVEPKTAAMVMAIVADKLGKPLNELRFISIKEID